MLETLANQKHIRSTETVVLVTGERLVAVNVRAAERRLKVERNGVASGSHRKCRKNSNAKAALKVPAKFLAFGVRYTLCRKTLVVLRELVHGAFPVFRVLIQGALVGTVGVSWHDEARSLPVDRELM